MYRCKVHLTHWGRVTHICVSKLNIIGSDNGLSPRRRQAIIWTNARILFMRTLGTNFSEILFRNQKFSFKKNALQNVVCEMTSICLGLDELNGPDSALDLATVLAAYVELLIATSAWALRSQSTYYPEECLSNDQGHGNIVETLYNTINFCWSSHKRHSIARPKGRGMGCLLWVQRATYCVDLSLLSSMKYLL